MSLKSQVLSLLEKSGDNPISGQEIAQQLKVSRSAIWKAVNYLREEGYIIKATTNKGYTLDNANDLISEEGIKQHLKIDKEVKLHIYKTIQSTNTLAKKMAIEGGANGTVIIADEQTQGRGRYGKSFFSPSGTGIYMSIIIKPDLNIEDSQLITIYTAVAVCKAIEKLTNLSPKIKWVNDIFLKDKKISGILTEATIDFESGRIESIIVGIGINIQTKEENFPDELTEIAGSLFPMDVSRNMIIAQILNEFFMIFKSIKRHELIQDYKSRSFILGMEISYDKGNDIVYGTAIDINENGNLIVKTRYGDIESLNSGEIRIKWKNKDRT